MEHSLASDLLMTDQPPAKCSSVSGCASVQSEANENTGEKEPGRC